MHLAETTSTQNFLDYLKFQKRYSEHTISSYKTDLLDFFDYTHVNYGVDIVNISAAFVRSWLASLKENKMASKSINRKISTLKTFFKYQLKNGVIEISPMSTIISLKVNKRLPSYIEEKDLNTLFRHVEFPDTWKGRTDRLLLQVFYQTGIRVSELVNLKIRQLDSSNQNIKVLGKGNKERLLPINNDLLLQLTEYIEQRKGIFEMDEEAIFVSKNGKKLYSRYVYAVVRHYLTLVTSNERRSPHILRHSFATHLTNHGADINAVKELLGHSSLAATQVYTHNTIEKLKAVHSKAHPRS